MTIADFYNNNIPDEEGRVTILNYTDLRTGKDVSLYISKKNEEQWAILQGSGNTITPVEPENELFLIVSHWLEDHFGAKAIEYNLDLSECFLEVFAQLQSTTSTVDIKHTSILQTLENGAWEIAQEGMLSPHILETGSSTEQIDVLLILTKDRNEYLSKLLRSEGLTVQSAPTIDEAELLCQNFTPQIIFFNATNLDKPSLVKLQTFSNKLRLETIIISIVDELSPFQTNIQGLSNDTYMEPVLDETFIRCAKKYNRIHDIYSSPIAQNRPNYTNTPNTLDVLIIYDQNSIDYFTGIFEQEGISSEGVRSISKGIAICAERTPTIILLDAKKLSAQNIKELIKLYRTKKQTTQLFAFITEASPYQNNILSIASKVFMVPTKTSEIMRHIHHNI